MGKKHTGQTLVQENLNDIQELFQILFVDRIDKSIKEVNRLIQGFEEKWKELKETTDTQCNTEGYHFEQLRRQIKDQVETLKEEVLPEAVNDLEEGINVCITDLYKLTGQVEHLEKEALSNVVSNLEEGINVCITDLYKITEKVENLEKEVLPSSMDELAGDINVCITELREQITDVASFLQKQQEYLEGEGISRIVQEYSDRSEDVLSEVLGMGLKCEEVDKHLTLVDEACKKQLKSLQEIRELTQKLQEQNSNISVKLDYSSAIKEMQEILNRIESVQRQTNDNQLAAQEMMEQQGERLEESHTMILNSFRNQKKEIVDLSESLREYINGEISKGVQAVVDDAKIKYNKAVIGFGVVLASNVITMLLLLLG